MDHPDVKSLLCRWRAVARNSLVQYMFTVWHRHRECMTVVVLPVYDTFARWATVGWRLSRFSCEMADAFWNILRVVPGQFRSSKQLSRYSTTNRIVVKRASIALALRCWIWIVGAATVHAEKLTGLCPVAGNTQPWTRRHRWIQTRSAPLCARIVNHNSAISDFPESPAKMRNYYLSRCTVHYSAVAVVSYGTVCTMYTVLQCVVFVLLCKPSSCSIVSIGCIMFQENS